MIHLCRHILPGGKLCDQASVRGTLYCRHHSTVKAAIEREHAAPDPALAHTPLALVYPEDKAAIQLNLFLVLQALNHKRIDVRTANAMNRILRACEQNLRTGALVETNREKVAQQVITLPNGDEIGMPREAVEAVEALYGPDEIHGLGCSCDECAGKADHLPNERHHAACRCGACAPATPDTGEALREAPVVDLHKFPPEPFDLKNAPAWLDAESQGPACQATPIAHSQDNRAREAHQPQARQQHERDEAIKQALAAEYELRTDSEMNWNERMKEALLSNYKQARAEGRPYTPRNLAATGA